MKWWIGTVSVVLLMSTAAFGYDLYDTDHDNDVDKNDLIKVENAAYSGGSTSYCDLNSDSAVDILDVRKWIIDNEIWPGDLNCDGVVSETEVDTVRSNLTSGVGIDNESGSLSDGKASFTDGCMYSIITRPPGQGQQATVIYGHPVDDYFKPHTVGAVDTLLVETVPLLPDIIVGGSPFLPSILTPTTTPSYISDATVTDITVVYELVEEVERQQSQEVYILLDSEDDVNGVYIRTRKTEYWRDNNHPGDPGPDAIQDKVLEFMKDTVFPGDADGDGDYDSDDIIYALQHGEYEDEIPGNSKWSEGDCSGDAEFDSTDFVEASSHGMPYED